MSESDFSLFPASTTLPGRQMVVAGILKLHPAPPVKLEIAICALLREVGTEQAFADGCSVVSGLVKRRPEDAAGSELQNDLHSCQPVQWQRLNKRKENRCSEQENEKRQGNSSCM